MSKKEIFTPGQLQLEGAVFRNRLEKLFERTQTAWKKIPKLALNLADSFIGMAVSAKTKIPKTEMLIQIV